MALVVFAEARRPLQSEWLIVAGCAGLLVNTVLLRYLLRVLGERRVLCIGVPSFLGMCILYANLHRFSILFQ